MRLTGCKLSIILFPRFSTPVQLGKKYRVMFLELYVAGVLIAFHEEEDLREVTLKLKERLLIKILGPVTYYLVSQCMSPRKVIFVSAKNNSRRTLRVQF